MQEDVVVGKEFIFFIYADGYFWPPKVIQAHRQMPDASLAKLVALYGSKALDVNVDAIPIVWKDQITFDHTHNRTELHRDSLLKALVSADPVPLSLLRAVIFQAPETQPRSVDGTAMRGDVCSFEECATFDAARAKEKKDAHDARVRAARKALEELEAMGDG